MSKINKTTMYNADEVRKVFNGILPECKTRLLAYLEQDGYVFFVNSSALTPTRKKWESLDCFRVASCMVGPHHLWAVDTKRAKREVL